MATVLLVLPSSTYRAPEFLAAASVLGVELLTASDARQAFAERLPERFVLVDLDDTEAAARDLAAVGARHGADAIVAVDDRGLVAAARASEALGLLTSPPDAVACTRDKLVMRERLAQHGVCQPRFVALDPDAPDFATELERAASAIGYPLVLKPTSLSASRGVVRVNDAAFLEEAAARVAAICPARDARRQLLVEEFVSGDEVALEAILVRSRLQPLALFDKPDPLEGPFFEETLYVTPSRHPKHVIDAVQEEVARACAALGLTEGPVHAEARLRDDGTAVIIEAAARTIGGKCSKALQFSATRSLEEIVLLHALGRDLGDTSLATGASGVMMLPIPRSGRLRAVGGKTRARAIAGITGLEMTAPIGALVRALPEGDRYLGFLFARGRTPSDVEDALRKAYGELEIAIDPLADDAP